MNWNILILAALLFCQSNCSTTETSPTTSTDDTVVKSVSELNDTLPDGNKTEAVATEILPTTQGQQIHTSAPPHPDSLETTSAGVMYVNVPGDNGIENVSRYDTDVTTQKDILVSTSPALNDVSQVNKIISEVPQGLGDTHLTAEWFSQTSETTTKQSTELTTESADKIIQSIPSKGIPSTTAFPNEPTPSEYLHVEHKDTVGRSIHPGVPSEQSGVVIIGAVLAFFCVTIFVAVVLVFRRRRQNVKQKVMMNFDLNRMDLRSIRHQPPNVVVVDFPLKQEADLWQDVKPMNSSVI